jgi:hypothetical protein
MARLAAQHAPNIGRDLFVLVASVGAAVFLAENHAMEIFFSGIGFVPLEAFIVGFFFTSLFTLAPASVALAEMSQVAPLSEVALWGAAGAVVGDLVLFFFVRDFLSADILALMRGSWLKKLKAVFKSPFLSWAVPVAGALVIASPIPDEIGVALLGLSKTHLRFFIPISYAMNFLGILLVGAAARVL